MAFAMHINKALFIKNYPYKFNDLHLDTKKCIYKTKLML